MDEVFAGRGGGGKDVLRNSEQLFARARWQREMGKHDLIASRSLTPKQMRWNLKVDL